MATDVPRQPSSLICTKLRPPRAQRLLSRSRLLGFFHENIHRKLLLVCAGPGYGKTSLLIDFARSTELPVCWYTLDESDRDPHTFLDYLMQSIRLHFPSFGGRVQSLLRRRGTSHAALREIVGVLVNELAEEIPEYIVVVLDDYHVLEGEDNRVGQVVDAMVRYLPENIHLVISGRTVPQLSLTRLAVYGEVEAIGADLLRFTTKEVQDLLQQKLGRQLSEAEADQLVTGSEGWVTGILLQAQVGRERTLEVCLQSPRPDGYVRTYFAEIVQALPPDLQTFLRQASIPSQLNAELCDSLLERQDSAAVLRYVERHNLFLVALAGGWYRFHALFREFLLRQMQAQGAAFVRLNLRAAELWRERGEPAETIQHLLQAQAYERAAREMDNWVQKLHDQSRFQLVIRWAESLPADLVKRQANLPLFAGKAYMAIGANEKARESLLQAEHAFAQLGNRVGWVQSLADRAFLERSQGLYGQALETAGTALAGTQEIRGPAIVDLYRTIGVSLHALGDLDQAEASLRQAVARSADTDLYTQALAFVDLGFCLRARGCAAEAQESYRQALERGRALGSPEVIANISNNLAMTPFLRGEFEEAAELLQQALRSAEMALSLRLQSLIRAGLGDLYRDRGEVAAAREIYARGLEQAKQTRDAFATTYLLDALGNLARQEGAFPQAHEYLAQALESAGSSRRDQAQVQTSLALLDAAEGNRARAVTRLEEVATEQEGGGWRLQLLRTRLAQAAVLHRDRRKRRARQVLRQAAALAGDMEVVEPFLAEGPALLPLLEEIAPGPGEILLQRVLARLRTRGISPIVPTEQVTRPILRILALGPSQLFRGEQEILAKDWPNRQSRELFFYLLFNSPARRGQIGLVFWPDLDTARMASTFHATLYKARRTVGQAFAIFQSDTYLWNPDVPCWCDVVEFRRLLDMAAATAQPIPLLEQAISLYQGDFLTEVDQEWCTLLREELRVQCLQALLRLGKLYLEQGSAQQALGAFRRAQQLDDLCEEAYRGLMSAHLVAGERSAAIQAYRQCCRQLSEELHVQPAAETRALYRTITRAGAAPQVR